MAAAQRGRRARVGGEDPRPRRAAAGVVAGGGDGRLRVPQRRRGAVRGSGRGGATHGPLARPGRRQPPLPRIRRASQVGAGIDDVRRRSAATSHAPPPGRSSGGLVVAAGLPHLHPRAPVRRGPRGRPRGRHRMAARRAARVHHPLPADDAAGDGQGRRGHGLLPLPAADGAQRRRRRPRSVRDHGRRIPRGGCRAPAARAARHPDARHQALGRRAGADRRARRHGRAVGGARARVADAARGDIRPARPRPGRALPRVPDAGRRVADRGPNVSTRTSRRRCARPSAPRAGSSPTSSTRRRSRRSRAGCSTCPSSARASTCSWPRSRRRASGRRSASWRSS